MAIIYLAAGTAVAFARYRNMELEAMRAAVRIASSSASPYRGCFGRTPPLRHTGEVLVGYHNRLEQGGSSAGEALHAVDQVVSVERETQVGIGARVHAVLRMIGRFGDVRHVENV